MQGAILLASPVMTDGRGVTIAAKVGEVLDEWKVKKDNLTSCCFDTTAVNTGHIDGAIAHLQQALNKALLWLACRHHVAEVVLGHVFSALEIEPLKLPEISLFTRFRSVFSSLSQCPQKLNFVHTKTPHLITREFDLLYKLKHLLSCDFPRDD